MGRLTSGCGCFVLPLFTCIFGAVFTLIAQGDMRDYLGSRSWVTADGEVVSSRLISSTDSDGDTTHRPQVDYFFYVGDERWTGNRLYFGDDISSSGGGAQKKVDEYPPGRAIKVSYDPDDPTESVVERRVSTALIIFSAIGIVALLATPITLILAVFGLLRAGIG